MLMPQCPKSISFALCSFLKLYTFQKILCECFVFKGYWIFEPHKKFKNNTKIPNGRKFLGHFLESGYGIFGGFFRRKFKYLQAQMLEHISLVVELCEGTCIVWV